MSDYAADASLEFRRRHKFPESPPARQWLHSSITRLKDKIVISHDRFLLRKLMSDFIGIVRTTNRLEMAHDRVRVILKEINSYYLGRPASYAIVELRNIALVAHLIIRSAMRRKESRGLHYVLDYPKTDDKRWKRDTIIRPSNYKPFRRKNG